MVRHEVAIRRDTRCVYLVNPNNPIPSVIDGEAMKEFVLEMSQKYLVFIDEAYHEFVDNPEYAKALKECPGNYDAAAVYEAYARENRS